MPTYEYRCKDCGHELEAIQSFSDDALTECPECHGALKKKFSAVGISFKGSGFYKTDSRGSSSAASPKSSADTATPAADKGSSSDAGSSSSGSDSSSSTSSSTASPASSGSSDGGSGTKAAAPA